MENEFLQRAKLYLAENFFRLVPVAALVLFIGVFIYAAQVDKYNRPPEELRLPSGTATGRPQVAGGGAGGLEVQNYSSPEISRMLGNIVAESLTFSRADFQSNKEAVRKYFTQDGYRQYEEFLTSSNFAGALEAGYRTGAYVEGEPLEVARGVYSGAYKWVFEAPITVSFIKQIAGTYQDDAVEPENRRYTLRAQFARVADPNDADAVRIEIWQILPPRRN